MSKIKMLLLFLAFILPPSAVFSQTKAREAQIRNWKFRDIITPGQDIDGRKFRFVNLVNCNKEGSHCIAYLNFTDNYDALYRINPLANPPVFTKIDPVAPEGGRYLPSGGTFFLNKDGAAVIDLRSPRSGYYYLSPDNKIEPLLLPGQPIPNIGTVAARGGMFLPDNQTIVFDGIVNGGGGGTAVLKYQNKQFSFVARSIQPDDLEFATWQDGTASTKIYGLVRKYRFEDIKECAIWPGFVDLITGKFQEFPGRCQPLNGLKYELNETGLRGIVANEQGVIIPGGTKERERQDILFCSATTNQCRVLFKTPFNRFPSSELWGQSEFSLNQRGEFVFDTRELSPKTPYPFPGLEWNSKNVLYASLYNPELEMVVGYDDQLFGDGTSIEAPGQNENRGAMITESGQVIFVHNGFRFGSLVLATRLNPDVDPARNRQEFVAGGLMTIAGTNFCLEGHELKAWVNGQEVKDLQVVCGSDRQSQLTLPAPQTVGTFTLQLAFIKQGDWQPQYQSNAFTFKTTSPPVPAQKLAAATDLYGRSVGELAPGKIITLWGKDLCAFPAPVPLPLHIRDPHGASLPTQLAGCEVFINGKAAPLYFAYTNQPLGGPATGLDSQINAVVPWDTLPGPAEVLVKAWDVNHRIFLASTILPAVVKDISPMFFDHFNYPLTIQALERGYSFIEAKNPLRISEIGALYATGLGKTTKQLPDGVLFANAADGQAPLVAEVKMTAGGQPVEILYAGTQGQYPGLYQVNFRLPDNTPITNGTVALTIQAGTAQPQTFTVHVVHAQ